MISPWLRLTQKNLLFRYRRCVMIEVVYEMRHTLTVPLYYIGVLEKPEPHTRTFNKPAALTLTALQNPHTHTLARKLNFLSDAQESSTRPHPARPGRLGHPRVEGHLLLQQSGSFTVFGEKHRILISVAGTK